MGDGGVSEDRESKLFPEPTSRNDVISCHALTPDFLIYGTDMGSLFFFFLEDWTIMHEFRYLTHNLSLKSMKKCYTTFSWMILDIITVKILVIYRTSFYRL